MLTFKLIVGGSNILYLSCRLDLFWNMIVRAFRVYLVEKLFSVLGLGFVVPFV